MMIDFKPTYLYIKQHSITGKMYFGKTNKSDPLKYNGSGKVWLRHIKKHGIEHVKTLWLKLFLNQEDCTEFALFFSEEMDVVKSDKWLNLIPENGTSGMPNGIKLSAEIKANMSQQRSKEHRANIGAANIGKILTAETRAKLAIVRKDKKFGSLSSEHCKKISIALKDRIYSDETKMKMSLSGKNKIFSEEHRANMSTAQKCKARYEQNSITCPHCTKVGGIGGMKRYHFDNCKMKEEE